MCDLAEDVNEADLCQLHGLSTHKGLVEVGHNLEDSVLDGPTISVAIFAIIIVLSSIFLFFRDVATNALEALLWR